MPLRHGVDVSVVSSTHETFSEYGVNTHARSKLVNAKIEARTGVRFHIVIRPEHPFPIVQNQRHGSRVLTRPRANDRLALSFQETPPTPRKGTPKFKISDLEENHSVEGLVEESQYNWIDDMLNLKMSDPIDFKPLNFRPRSDLNLLSEPVLSAKAKDHHFDLIAEVFLDGRAKAEIRSIVYLNLADYHYSKSGTILPGRRVRGLDENDGPVKTCIHEWVFTDVGIEVLLERMGVEDAGTDESDLNHQDHEVADLADMLQDTANVDNKREAERELKVGKIEVVLTRVVLGKSIRSGRRDVLKSLHYQGGEQQTPKKAMGKDVTHITSIVAPNPSYPPTFKSKNYTTVKWKHYNPAEDFYAKFTFDYTSRAKLVKWGLCDERGVPAEKKRAKGEERRVEGEAVARPRDKRKLPAETPTSKQDGSNQGGDQLQLQLVRETSPFSGPETRSMKQKRLTSQRSIGGYYGHDNGADRDDEQEEEGEENKLLEDTDHAEDRRARLRPRK